MAITMSCMHLAGYMGSKGTDVFRLLCKVFLEPYGDESTRKKKAEMLHCQTCANSKHGKYSTRLMACLTCRYVGCHEHKHLKKHAVRHQHCLALDLSWGVVYCLMCSEFIYNRELECLFRENGAKIYNREWWPGPKQLKQTLSPSVSLRPVYGHSTLGLRGLVNLGNTCFMNCIVQTLCHTPLLRDYFLCACPTHQCIPPTTTQNCLVCEMSRTFQQIYSGERKPHAPIKLLFLIWQNSIHLAGYEQQDAHEFLIATLDLLHQHCKGTNGAPSHNVECPCIIDQIFTGSLQSDVTCQSCYNVSTKVDPLWDISLDIVLDSTDLLDSISSSSGSSSSSNTPSPLFQQENGGAASNSTSLATDRTSLLDCLKRFTRSEHLGIGGKINCSTCNKQQESTKQLSMRKLPIVICFHLKRFEHSLRLHKKISTFVSFPEKLDMTPFMHYNMAKGNNNLELQSRNSSIMGNVYTLFAVVVHAGTIEGGHYRAYIKHFQDQWYRCDDLFITRACVEEVLHSEAYLLFYHRINLSTKDDFEPV